MVLPGQAASNRCTMPDGNCGTPTASNCIGSACMAWRWSAVPNPDYKPAEYLPMGAYLAPVGDPHVLSKTDGVCGLASRI